MSAQSASGGNKWFIACLIVALAGIAMVATHAMLNRPGDDGRPRAKASGRLTAFASDDQLRHYLRLAQARSRRASDLQAFDVAEAPAAMSADAAGQAEPPPPSITNTQEAGVDEGGIVKVHGDMLVILRRGRLFTVSTADGGMRPIASIDAFPPGVSGQGDWYDEMLISGDRVIVVGYSYARGGTEINRFRIDAAGALSFEDAWHLRSNDYYSSRNYASRLIGNRLIFYTPLYLNGEGDPLDALPGLRKWEPGQDRSRPFRRIAPANRIFVAPGPGEDRQAGVTTLHSVTTCDLTAPELDCTATGVLGPESRTFYVSPGAVYLWVADWTPPGQRRGGPEAFIVRLPFGGDAPSAIGARGAPVDQFSFREDGAENMLNVLVREAGGGDAMGNAEASGGRVALLRLPIAEFGDGSRAAGPARYRQLPSPRGDSWEFHNRFVGDHVLYGAGGASEDGWPGIVTVAPLGGGPAVQLQLRHAVDRIEVLGRDALVVGAGAQHSLGFSAVALPGRGAPALADVFTLPAASEGETRSHAFFFRPTNADGSSGIVGLPIARPAGPAYERFFGSAAAMLFLRRDDGRFSPAGELGAELSGTVDDACQASCTDWYGNARPIFLRNRIFALLGYELVEGRIAGGAIREIGRVNFSPRPRPPARD